MNMNKLTKRILCVICVIAFLLVYGKAGECDYNEEVKQEMGNSIYFIIKDMMGEDCSDRDIVREYKKNQKYYDHLKSQLNI